jgi:hypothetical protein
MKLILSFLLITLFFSQSTSGEQMKQCKIIPEPQKVMWADGKFCFDKSTKLYFEEFEDRSEFVTRRISKSD